MERPDRSFQVMDDEFVVRPLLLEDDGNYCMQLCSIFIDCLSVRRRVICMATPLAFVGERVESSPFPLEPTPFDFSGVGAASVGSSFGGRAGNPKSHS